MIEHQEGVNQVKRRVENTIEGRCLQWQEGSEGTGEVDERTDPSKGMQPKSASSVER